MTIIPKCDFLKASIGHLSVEHSLHSSNRVQIKLINKYENNPETLLTTLHVAIVYYSGAAWTSKRLQSPSDMNALRVFSLGDTTPIACYYISSSAECAQYNFKHTTMDRYPYVPQ